MLTSPDCWLRPSWPPDPAAPDAPIGRNFDSCMLNRLSSDLSSPSG